MKNKVLYFILFLLIVLLFLSIFKNIQYPLLWHDEAETALFAERILKFGYPKVHDGKNIVSTGPLQIAVDKNTDAYIWSNWSQFYFAAIGESFAKYTSDLYLKTAILRIPFAIIGFLGILLWGYNFTLFFKDIYYKLLFLTSFIFLEFLSVPLIHHLREVRYYSILIFLFACYFYIYIKRVYLNKLDGRQFWAFSVIFTILLFNTFYPAALIFSASIFIHQLYLLISKNIHLKRFINEISPLILSFLLIIPQIYFFNTIGISNFLYKYSHFPLELYFMHIGQILHFFLNYNYLFLILLINVFIVVFIVYNKKGNPAMPSLDMLKVSNFLKLFVCLYILVIAKGPFFYERYFIVLQPIATAIFILDGLLFYELMNNIDKNNLPQNLKRITLFFITLIFLFNVSNNFYPLREHFHELFHQYKGPLDYIIPYITQNYKDPENLIISTNYEETSYMYYLKAKTIIGFLQNNLMGDLKETPDIIIFRKFWVGNHDREVLSSFFVKAKYEKKLFPVYDNPYNNIPESALHLYRTKFAQNKNEAVCLFSIKKDCGTVD